MIHELIEQMGHADYAQRSQAVRHLIGFRANAIDPLCAVLERGNWHRRINALEASKQINDVRAIVPIVQTIRANQSPEEALEPCAAGTESPLKKWLHHILDSE